MKSLKTKILYFRKDSFISVLEGPRKKGFSFFVLNPCPKTKDNILFLQNSYFLKGHEKE